MDRIVFPPRDSNPVWKLVHVLLTLLRPLFCRLRVQGRHNIPQQGGVVIACNHPGGTDVFVLGYASTRQIYYMAKEELFQIGPWLNLLLFAAGAFPVRRGRQDSQALARSIEIVAQRRVLGMFPEGRRNHGKGLLQGRTGTVRIALKTGVPIVPAAVTGILELNEHWYNPLRRPLVTVRFGEPILLRDGPHDHRLLQEQTDQVMRAIAALLPSELRGAYAAAADASASTPPD